MKFIIKLLLSAGITLLASQFFPFWVAASGIVIINIIIRSNGFVSFISGFFGMGITWTIYAWILASGDAAIINEKMSQILMGVNPDYMFLLSGLIGAITGGISGLTGHLFSRPVKKTTNMSNNPYH